MRKSLEIALARYRFNIKSARYFSNKNVDEIPLIITDDNMPGIKWHNKIVKACENKCDFIIMTGNTTLSRAIEAVRFGSKIFNQAF